MSNDISYFGWAILNQAITTSYAQVTYTRPIRGFRVQCRGDSVVFHKKLTGDTNYYTIKARTNHPYELYNMDSSPSLGFFRTEDGSDTLEIIVFF